MSARELEPLLGTSHFRVLIGRRELCFSEVGGVTSETDLALPPAGVSDRRPAPGPDALDRAVRLAEAHRRRQRRPPRRHDPPMNEDHTQVVQEWRLLPARIVKHVSGPLNAKGTDVAMEELTLAYERLELD